MFKYHFPVQKNELRGEPDPGLPNPTCFALITEKLSPAQLATTGVINSLQRNIFNIISVPRPGRFKWGFSYVSTAGSRAVLIALTSAAEQPQRVTVYLGQNYHCAQPGLDGGRSLWSRICFPFWQGCLFPRQGGASNCIGPVWHISEVLMSTKTCFHHCQFLLTVMVFRHLPIRLSLTDPCIAFHNVYPEKKKLLNFHNKRFFNSSKAFIVTTFLAFFSL